MKIIGDDSLDDFRHDVYRNDVQAVIIPIDKEHYGEEFVWCRLRQKLKNHIYEGILLNEPLVNTGLHKQYDTVLILEDGYRLLVLPIHKKPNDKYGMCELL